MTIDADSALQAVIAGCQVHAFVGEQWVSGVDLLQRLRASGQLGAVVVVALGTNGPVSRDQFAQMMAVLVGVRRVVVVTDHAPRYWEEANNALFEAEALHYPAVRIAGWDALAKNNPSWFYPDGTHMPLGGPGARAFAELVKARIRAR
ncbi:MAG: SGNH/GDSL hydrolase family protein [Acidimicrobiales bacterium]